MGLDLNLLGDLTLWIWFIQSTVIEWIISKVKTPFLITKFLFLLILTDSYILNPYPNE
jgi:hypothetical protein